jgi:hypothetical protein
MFDEIHRLWGDRLRPADRVHPALSAADRAFLTTVGLPVFEPDIGISTVHNRLDQVVTRNGRQFVVVAERVGIGRESAVELTTGRVYLIDTPEFTRPPELENSGLALFVLFLGIFERDLLPTLATLDEGSAELDRVRARLTALDPDGMRDGGSWDLHLRDYEV